MDSKIKIGAVSYLNTAPLLYGIQHSPLMDNIVLSVDYPSVLAQKLSNREIDVALLPVAAIPTIPGATIISEYGIAADGKVASVALFSRLPLDEVETVYLDYQSRTSVKLVQLLFKYHWKKEVVFKQASEHYIDYINDTTAGVIIGDRALKQLVNFEYIYDLSEAWKEYTGLPFVFAAWVTNKELPETFTDAFNQANRLGVEQIDKVVSGAIFPYYDLEKYYSEHIHYYLDENKKKGLDKFLELIQTL